MDLDMNYDEADPLYKRVLSRKLTRLIADLDVDGFLDSLVTKDIINSHKIRDIRELTTTTAKVRKIVELFCQRSHEDYNIFLFCLDDSSQVFLRKELEEEEEELKSHTRHRGTADLQQGLSAPGGQGDNAVQTKESVCNEKQQTPDAGGQNVFYERKQGTSSPSTEVTIPTGEATTTAQKQETTSPGRQETLAVQKQESISENTAADETSAAQKQETTSPGRQETSAAQKQETTSPGRRETMQPGVKVAYVAPMQVDLTEQTKTSKTGTLETLEFSKKNPTDIDSVTKNVMIMNITSDGATGGMDKLTRLQAVPDEEVIENDEPNTVPSSSLSSLIPKTDVRKLEDGSLLLTEHYDVCLVYAEEDDEMANDVMTSLKKMDLGTEGSDCENCPKVIGFDEAPFFIAKPTELMEIIYKHCTLLFVIISEHKLSSFAKELQNSSFMKSVDERKNKVLPLITQKDHKKHIPYHMSDCWTLDYYNRSRFDRQVKGRIQLIQHQRLNRLQENLTSRLG